MKYPEIKQHIRFYKYAGKNKIVIVEDPIENRCANTYEENPGHSMNYCGYKLINSYINKFDDWAQVNKPPNHIPDEQVFDWYFQSWEKNK